MKKLICILLLLSAVKVQAQLPGYLPSSGLTAWFPFTGNAIDSTNNGHNGTVAGCTMATGRFGMPNTAYRFNGTSNYIYIPAGTFERQKSVDITASLTISAWVKSPNYFYNPQSQIYWRGDNTAAHDPHMLYFNSGQVKVRRDIDPGTVINEVGYSITSLDTNFHLMTGTYDSTSGMMRIYLDGVEKNSSYLPGLQTYPTSTMYNYIGAVDGGTAQFFYGVIDELGIWNRALTPCEVAALYGSVPNIITAQPADDTVDAGTIVTFHAGVVAPSAVYQWQVDNGTGFTDLTNTAPYSGVTTATLTISPAHFFMNGYKYRCIVSSGTCVNMATDGAILTVNFSAGVAGNSKPTSNLAVIPNPTNGQLAVTGYFPGSDDVAILITDLAGRIVHEESARGNGGQIDKQLSLGLELAGGVYILQVRNATRSEKTLFLLQR